MKVVLSPPEIMEAALSGVMRHVENLKNGKKPTYGCGVEQDWQLHIEGCLAERALAKHLNIYWRGKGKPTLPDVGLVDVRCSPGHNNRLILHSHDEDDRVFWFLTGINGTYIVRGWILGVDGKNQEYWADPQGGRPAYFVPQGRLNN